MSKPHVCPAILRPWGSAALIALVACSPAASPVVAPRPLVDASAPDFPAAVPQGRYRVIAAHNDGLELLVTQEDPPLRASVRVTTLPGGMDAEVTLASGAQAHASLAWLVGEGGQLTLDGRFAASGVEIGVLSVARRLPGEDELRAGRRVLYVPRQSSLALLAEPSDGDALELADADATADIAKVTDWLARHGLLEQVSQPPFALAVSLLHDPAFLQLALGGPGPVGAHHEGDVAVHSHAIHLTPACTQPFYLNPLTAFDCGLCVGGAIFGNPPAIIGGCSRCLLRVVNAVVFQNRACARSAERRFTPAQCEVVCARQSWYRASVSADQHDCDCTCDERKCEAYVRDQSERSGGTFCHSACDSDGLCNGQICGRGFECDASTSRCVSVDCQSYGCGPDPCRKCVPQEDGASRCEHQCAAPLYRWEITAGGGRGEGYTSEDAATAAGIAASQALWQAPCEMRPRTGEFPQWRVTITIPALPIPGATYFCPDVHITAYCATGTLDVPTRQCLP